MNRFLEPGGASRPDEVTVRMLSKLSALRERYRRDGLAGATRAVGRVVARTPAGLRRRLKAYRVDRWKRSMDEEDSIYEHEPRVSLIFQWFNQESMVSRVAPRLPEDPAYETIVCEDGSVDGSLAAWDAELTRRNDFLVRSNDLHEIRSYTRAIGLARGEVVCLLQDDDDLPADTGWIDDALALFDAHPDLAVLCGQSAWGLQDLDPAYRFDPPGDGETATATRAGEGDGVHPELEAFLRGEVEGYKDERPGEVPTVDPETGQPFVFTPCISVGPVFVRRAVFEELGGFDLAFSEPGHPGMGFEVDLGLRCWEAGYEVGFTPMGFDRGEVGGTNTFAQQDRDDAHEAAWRKLRADHGEQFDPISERVWEASSRLEARE